MEAYSWNVITQMAGEVRAVAVDANLKSRKHREIFDKTITTKSHSNGNQIINS